jgi:hypothetical protein
MVEQNPFRVAPVTWFAVSTLVVFAFGSLAWYVAPLHGSGSASDAGWADVLAQDQVSLQAATPLVLPHTTQFVVAKAAPAPAPAGAHDAPRPR